MKQEPKRWLELGEADERLRSLMQVGASDVAPPAVLARTARRLSSHLGVTVDSAPHTPAERCASDARPPAAPAATDAAPGFAAFVLKSAAVGLLLAAGWLVAGRSAQRPSVASPALPARVEQRASPAPSSEASPRDVPELLHATSARGVAQATSSQPGANAREPTPAPKRTLPKRRRDANSEPSARAPAVTSPNAREARAEPEREPITSLPEAIEAEAPDLARAAAAPTDDGAYVWKSTIVEGKRLPMARTPPSPPDTRLEELRALEQAQRELRHHPSRALAALRVHATRYPASWLEQEREVLVIRALHVLRDGERARAALRAFKARYPESAHIDELAQAQRELDAP